MFKANNNSRKTYTNLDATYEKIKTILHNLYETHRILPIKAYTNSTKNCLKHIKTYHYLSHDYQVCPVAVQWEIRIVLRGW